MAFKGELQALASDSLRSSQTGLCLLARVFSLDLGRVTWESAPVSTVCFVSVKLHFDIHGIFIITASWRVRTFPSLPWTRPPAVLVTREVDPSQKTDLCACGHWVQFGCDQQALGGITAMFAWTDLPILNDLSGPSLD